MNLSATVTNDYLLNRPLDAARVLETIADDELTVELEGVDAKSLIATLDYMSPSRAAAVFARVDASCRRDALMIASPRLALLLLSRLPDEAASALLASLPAAAREDLERLMSFPPDTAGRLMDRSFESFYVGMSVQDALERVRGSDIRRARSLYVVDEQNRLAGRADMQDLALAERDARLTALMQPIDGAVSATAPRQEVVDVLDTHRLDSVPVVDVDGRLMGVVRYNRLFEAIEDVAIAGLQKMVGNPDERALSTAGVSVGKRLPWLHVNLVTAFLAAAVVGLFENLIAQFTALAVLLPVVAGQSGNAGSQALAVTIRGLALREIGTREWRRVLGKEMLVGVVNGLVLALTCGLGVYLWSTSVGLSLVIGFAMVLSMVAAGIAGALVPIVLTRLGQDPATASSIILTTVTDVAGFFSFLGTAAALSFML